MSVAGPWGLATMWTVTMFLACRWLTPFADSAVSFVHLTVAGAAFALCILSWHLVRRRSHSAKRRWRSDRRVCCNRPPGFRRWPML
jgi:hypothetical protein